MEDIEPYTRLIKAMKEQSEEDKQFMQRVNTAFEALNLHNSIYAELLVDLAEILTEITIEHQSPASELELDEQHGAGINLYSAIGSLYDYLEGDDDVCLDVALAHIFREKERRILNEI